MEKSLKKNTSLQKWHSIHIYYQNEPLPLLVCLNKIIREHSDHIKCWFFIRYFDQKKHIRLRILFKPNIKQTYKSLFFIYIKNLANNEKLEIIDIKFDRYLPEINRYGGEVILKYAEEHFMLSSDYYLKNISKKIHAEYLKELLVLNLMILLAFDLKIKEIKELNFKMYQIWLPVFKYHFPNIKNPDMYLKAKVKPFLQQFIHLLNDIFNDNIVFNGMLNNWYNSNSKLAQKYYRILSKEDLLNNKKYNAILPSLIHMNNNRFGASNYEEAYISFITYYAISKLKKIK